MTQNAETVCNIRGGEYTHWRCQRPRLHFGPHRFNNYTWGWLPRVWHLADLGRWTLLWVKWTRLHGWGQPRPRVPWRRVLWPADYRPIRCPQSDSDEEA